VKRSERHHLKQDELVSGLGQATDWFQAHRNNIINGVLVLLGAGLLLGGIYMYRKGKSQEARGALASALEQYHGQVGPDAGGSGTTSANVPKFGTADEKYRAALQAFEKVATDFGSYDQGRQARYYAGLCQLQLGDLEAAEKSLSELRSGKRDLLYYLASKAAAAVATERGNYAAAAEIYRPLVEDEKSPLPKDHLLFELAKAEERAGNREQARRYYDRVLSEFPQSQLRGDALSRKELLDLEPAASGG
jgi:tetratricopeptide (TPR) repeat protein